MGETVENRIVVHEFADRSLSGPHARHDRAGIFGDPARCRCKPAERFLRCDDDLIHVVRSFSDRLGRIGDVAFNFVDRSVEGRYRFAYLRQEVADLKRFSTGVAVCRRQS